MLRHRRPVLVDLRRRFVDGADPADPFPLHVAVAVEDPAAGEERRHAVEITGIHALCVGEHQVLDGGSGVGGFQRIHGFLRCEGLRLGPRPAGDALDGTCSNAPPKARRFAADRVSCRGLWGEAMGIKRFDRKFGRDFLGESTTGPAVYLFRDGAGDVLYVGKAKNARRRLAQYRNATRRKAHRKMRAIVREAESLEVRAQASEAEALLVENELIRTLRPPFNVEGAFDFLYPAIGVGRHEGRLVLCFTSAPEAFARLDLSWHGTFRPRWRARQAFDGLCLLFGHLGHAEPRSRLPALPDRRGARVFAARRIATDFTPGVRAFFDGESDGLLGELATALLEERGARLEAATIEEELRFLARFYERDAARLRDARRAVDHPARFVCGHERDALFIRSRHATNEPAP